MPFVHVFILVHHSIGKVKGVIILSDIILLWSVYVGMESYLLRERNLTDEGLNENVGSRV